MFRVSRVDLEGPFQASQWLYVQVLLDQREIRSLFAELGELLFVPVGCVLSWEYPTLPKESFFKAYDRYVEGLKLGELVDPSSYFSAFSCALSLGPEELYAVELSEKTLLVKPSLPVVQMQAHSMGYSVVDEKITPMVRGPDTISWGIQFGFPTLYLEKNKKELSSTLEKEEFRNAQLFRTLQKWMRTHTRPTPMMIRQKLITLPVRLGHGCFGWINNHPTLRFHGLVVDHEGDEG